MPNWQRTIYLQPHWDLADEGKISIGELAGIIAGHLRSMRPFGDDRIDSMRDELIEEFEWLAQSEDVTRDDFDNWMSEIYDWADIHISGGFFDAKKVCWIDLWKNKPQSPRPDEERSDTAGQQV